MKSEAQNTQLSKCRKNESRHDITGCEESHLDMNPAEKQSPSVQKSDYIVT